jgi:hypothetical protein
VRSDTISKGGNTGAVKQPSDGTSRRGGRDVGPHGAADEEEEGGQDILQSDPERREEGVEQREDSSEISSDEEHGEAVSPSKHHEEDTVALTFKASSGELDGSR